MKFTPIRVSRLLVTPLYTEIEPLLFRRSSLIVGDVSFERVPFTFVCMELSLLSATIGTEFHRNWQRKGKSVRGGGKKARSIRPAERPNIGLFKLSKSNGICSKQSTQLTAIISVVTIAPSQTAAIAAFSRIWAQIAASVAPYHIGATTRQGLLEEWRVVFIIIAVMCVITGIFFQCYGTSDVQDWDTVSVKGVETTQQELIDKSLLDSKEIEANGTIA
ncbi:unnamed protein product [Caenorhabditis auriculariae]|uniref:Major facilitator superfamily (MFS) profile domain-containing protein n=1 Tax=Caenorhabditis auriculariae TaxID=2777116 RepID=A0A8S1HQ36_9PELO|nr:unnamed protein product [Caenorhabditis auriculariae]